MELKVQLSGSAQQTLGRAVAHLANTEPLMASVSTELLSIAELSFEKEAGADGKKWPDLAPRTIAKRKKKGHWPGKKLQISAAGLAASVQPFHSATEAGLSSAKVYAAVQQLGGKAGRGLKAVIPPRPYMPIRRAGENFELEPSAERSILDLARHFVEGAIG